MNYQRGQILLIVVLVMTIALTIGLSVASRTITNIRTSTEEESSQRAFSAAEAGIEKALQENTGSSGSLTNNATYQTSISALSGTEFLLNNGSPVLKDNAVDLWLSTYPNFTNPWSGTLTIYWNASPGVCNPNENITTMAALDILLISGAKDSPTSGHYPVDPCNARAAINNFELISAGGATVSNKALSYKKTIVVSSGLLIRIIPLYSASLIGVKGCDTNGNNCIALPAQGTLVTSIGTSSNSQRKIVGFKENPKLPVQMFPYILFSPR